MRWHYVITDKMRRAGLTGNALLVFAVLDGYSQNRQGCYFGSLEYLADVVGCSRRTLIYTLQKLEEDGFIKSTERTGKATIYTTCDLDEGGCKNCTEGVQKLHTGGAKIAPDNNNYNACINTSDSSKSARVREEKFVAPSVEEVAEYATANGYTLVDAAAFWGHYQSIGWKVGKAPMKDWRAAVVGWNAREAKREAETPAGTRPNVSRARENAIPAGASQRHHNMMAMLHKIQDERAAKEGGCDEQ